MFIQSGLSPCMLLLNATATIQALKTFLKCFEGIVNDDGPHFTAQPSKNSVSAMKLTFAHTPLSYL